MFSSSDRDKREINKYHAESNNSGGDSESEVVVVVVVKGTPQVSNTHLESLGFL